MPKRMASSPAPAGTRPANPTLALARWFQTWGLWIATALLLSLPLLFGLHYITGKLFAWRGLAAGLGVTGLLLATVRLHRRLPKTWSIALAVAITAIYFAHLLYFGVAQFSGRGFDDGFFLSLQAEAVNVAWNQYTRYFMIFAAGLVAIYVLIYAHSSRPAALGWKSTTAVVLASLFLLAKGYYTLPVWQLATATKTWMHPSEIEIPPDLLAKWSKSTIINLDLPTKAMLQAKRASPARNLILLYVESGGVMMKPASKYPGIAPNFEKLIRTNSLVPSIHASSYFTMEGLVNTQCGTLLPFEGGNDAMAGFGNRVYQMPCLGDVLHKAGYQQIYFSGTSRNFAGAGPFLEIHGYDRIAGQEDWARQKVYQTPGTYGISDKELLQLSISEIKRLETSNRPYNLTIFTIGTHIPGFSYDGCQPYGDGHDRYLNAVHCTDELVGNWLNELQKGDLLKNTIVVITGDHQVFANEQMKNLFGDDVHDYRLPLIVIGHDLPKPARQDGAGYDLAPTILDLLGIDTNAKFALGRSLLRNDRKTDYVLSRYNDFYEGKIYFTHGEEIPCNAPATETAQAPRTGALPLDQCARSELASLLKYQARKYSERMPRVDCETSNPLSVATAEGKLKVMISGEDVSRFFTRIGVPTVAGTPGTYVLGVAADGRLNSQSYFQPGDTGETLSHIRLPPHGAAVVIGLSGAAGGKEHAPALHIDGTTTTGGDGIWIYQADAPNQPRLVSQATLAQGYDMAPGQCRMLTQPRT